MSPAPTTIYLDHGASTPMEPEVLDAMRPYFLEHYANPSSSHPPGRAARRAVEDARQRLAKLWQVAPNEVVFTSGGTESDVLALRGLALSAPDDRRDAWLFALEHPAVTAQQAWLEAQGFQVHTLPANAEGFVDLERFAREVTPATSLVAVMHVNNELGTIQPIADIRAVLDTHAPGAFLHVDAVQSFTKTEVRPDSMGATTLAIAAHKFHGPKGAGALYVRSGTPLVPQVVGGGHERGIRSGTENVPGIVGLVVAAERALASFEDTRDRIAAQRDRLVDGILGACPTVALNGARHARQCNNANLHVPGCSSWALLSALEARGIIASAGSACQSARGGPSPVLQAIGRTDPSAANLRLTLSRLTTDSEITEAIPRIVEAIAAVTA